MVVTTFVIVAWILIAGGAFVPTRFAVLTVVFMDVVVAFFDMLPDIGLDCLGPMLAYIAFNAIQGGARLVTAVHIDLGMEVTAQICQ